jgi:xylulose-5-phosphate/fructose-6-phosphate phosphoketolase
VFAFHGYAGAVHQLLHGRRNAQRFHVRGYREEGTTTTPFDMVVLNQISRFHLVMEALRRVRPDRVPDNAAALTEACEAQLAQHRRHVCETFEDMSTHRTWTWPP